MVRTMEKPVPRSPSPDERVYAAIHEAVQENRLEPGLKLKEAELTAVFNVSRASVRTALLRLSQKGLLELVPNRGATVAKPSAEECRQILESRLAIEGMVIEVLARAPNPVVVKALRRHVKLQQRAFEAGNMQEGHRLAIAFHRLLASHCGNRVLAQLLDDLLSRMPLVILTHGTRHADGEATHADHIELVAAIADGEVGRARRILQRHLSALQDELDLGASVGNGSLRQMLKQCCDRRAPVRIGRWDRPKAAA
jgi:DNA-binding GntR family transcriptional regulator